jgi:hypothetical protein
MPQPQPQPTDRTHRKSHGKTAHGKMLLNGFILRYFCGMGIYSAFVLSFQKRHKNDV